MVVINVCADEKTRLIQDEIVVWERHRGDQIEPKFGRCPQVFPNWNPFAYKIARISQPGRVRDGLPADSHLRCACRRCTTHHHHNIQWSNLLWYPAAAQCRHPISFTPILVRVVESSLDFLKGTRMWIIFPLPRLMRIFPFHAVKGYTKKKVSTKTSKRAVYVRMQGSVSIQKDICNRQSTTILATILVVLECVPFPVWTNDNNMHRRPPASAPWEQSIPGEGHWLPWPL